MLTGSATILEYNIAEKEEMEQIRQFSAVCPQFNIQFEYLTVKENLKTFAKIKGIPFSDVENEVSIYSEEYNRVVVEKDSRIGKKGTEMQLLYSTVIRILEITWGSKQQRFYLVSNICFSNMLRFKSV